MVEKDKMILNLGLFKSLKSGYSKYIKNDRDKKALLENLLEYVKKYLDLVIAMFEGENDESANQIKNLGFTESFCNLFLDSDILEVLKVKVWKIFLNIYLKFPKTLMVDLPVFFE